MIPCPHCFASLWIDYKDWLIDCLSRTTSKELTCHAVFRHSTPLQYSTKKCCILCVKPNIVEYSKFIHKILYFVFLIVWLGSWQRLFNFELLVLPVLEGIMHHITIWAHPTLQLAYFTSNLQRRYNAPLHPFSIWSASHDFWGHFFFSRLIIA